MTEQDYKALFVMLEQYLQYLQSCDDVSNDAINDVKLMMFKVEDELILINKKRYAYDTKPFFRYYKRR